MDASPIPTLLPLGDSALLVRFGTTLDDAANRAAINLARSLVTQALPPGVVEVVPNLVSVLVRYDPVRIGFDALAGEIRLRLGAVMEWQAGTARTVRVRFDGEDLAEVAATLGLRKDAFVAAHNAGPLRVLATGFAPGFVYCGFHKPELVAPRRPAVRPMVPAGTILFAAGQTAIAATPIPTGWHVIGHTDFANFDPAATPPTRLAAGDELTFEAAA
jgi:KipI family sensor histidine kinase inhibitor